MIKASAFRAVLDELNLPSDSPQARRVMQIVFARVMSETATKTIEAMAEATGLEMEEVAKIVTNGKVEIIN